MSRIYFHTRDEGAAELSGSERAYMGIMVEHLAGAFIPEYPSDREVRKMEVHPTTRADDIRRRWFGGFFGDQIPYRGDKVRGWSVALNTVLAIGNDELRLLARLHAQCEIHAYVQGHNRRWMAECIRRGRETGLYRPGQGWEDVEALLRKNDDAPVVTSYSVTEQFPNRHLSDWAPADDDPDGEKWYELPEGEAWDLSMSALRKEGEKELEMGPGLVERRFTHDLTMFDIMQYLRED